MQEKLMNIFESCVDNTFWSPSTKFIFVATQRITENDLTNVFQFFKVLKRLNVVLILDQEQNEHETATKMMTFNILQGTIESVSPTTNADLIFPDKLSDMNGYKYKIIATDQEPSIIQIGKFFSGTNVFLIYLIAKSQNATISLEYYDRRNRTERMKYDNLMLDGEVDINLNTEISNIKRKNLKTVNTYDTDGYCAIVPLPPKYYFFEYIFTPFDNVSWIFFGISVAAVVVVWNIFKAFPSGPISSTSHITLRIISGFFGQPVLYRHSRWFHALVIQIFIFVMMFLGNVYQSRIISVLMMTRNGTKISTVNEMINGNYNFYADYLFYTITTTPEMNFTFEEKYQRYSGKFEDIDFGATAENNSVLITRCDRAGDLFYTKHFAFHHAHPDEFYFILPEKIIVLNENLLTSRFSPFTKRLEEMSLKVFESGIRQYWSKLLYNLTDGCDLRIKSIVNEDYLLKMNDLKYTFYVLGFGMFAASIAFLLEVFWSKFGTAIKCFTVRNVKPFRRSRRRHVLMVRRIQAQPRVQPFIL